MTYAVSSSVLEPVRKALPAPAFLEFVAAANAAGSDHNECMRAAWADVALRWEKPKGAIHWSRKKEFRRMHKMERTGTPVTVLKVDEEMRIVFGWASVITEADLPVVDTQNHVILADTLLRATTEFMKSVRMAKAMHDGDGIGEVVHSFPLTTDISKALGINLNGREGWIVGVYVEDDATWELVKSGDLPAFSIGGEGQMEDYDV